ncbi:MAG: ketoreductase and phosphopantetheine attachment site domain-containing protein, partial [Gammaproteobacteria bacterium]|nr:ketoreductase and phosphopantetheine attachment site domain-containing protein [Gammaproteobacteria bacterium]
DDLSLPVEIQRIQCWRHDFADSHWISGGLNSVDQVDLFIYNRKHQLQFSITGVKVATVSEHRFKQMLMPVKDWYYQSTWRPHRIISNEKPRSWLLIYAKPDETIAKQLSDQGHHVRMWHYKQGMDIDLSGVDEIVDLTALTVLADPQRAMSFCEHLLSLLKRMTGFSPRLTLVTRHAQGEFTQHLNYSGAALWGIAAVLFQEHAELSPRIIDLNSDQNLLTALLDNSGEQRLVVTEQEIFGQRLQRYQNNSVIRIKIDSQASYLITGGLGALGWVTARWLVAQGARHLYITTRQTNPQLPAGLKTLQDQYPELELTVCSTEITQEHAIVQLFDEIEQSGIPLKGIIHSAGYSDDDLLINQSAERLEQLNQVKLIAAVMLDKASRKMPLDFFLLYSSLNVLLGNVGQGAYAAANAAMDALAWQRNHDGFPALSINWGPWQIGMQQNSQAGMQEHWQQSGLNLIDESHADLILDQLMNSKDTQVCIADLDWQTIARNNAFGDRSGLLQELIPVTNNEISGATTEAFLQQLSTADPGQLKTLLTDWVGQQLTQILKLPRHQLALENPLSSMGLDSLAAVELRAQMRKTLQLEVPVSQLLQSDGFGLIQYLEQQLSSSQQVEAIDVGQQEMLEGEL